MMTTTPSRFLGRFLAAVLLAGSLSTPAAAQSPKGREDSSVAELGVGAGYGMGAGLVGVGTVGAVYDTGPYHVDVLLGFHQMDDVSTSFGVGGRFYYAIHHARSSDLSLGGGLGLVLIDPARGDNDTAVLLEGGAKVRVFLVSNVCFSVTFGLAGQFLDGASSISIAGGPVGGAAITYFLE